MHVTSLQIEKHQKIQRIKQTVALNSSAHEDTLASRSECFKYVASIGIQRAVTQKEEIRIAEEIKNSEERMTHTFFGNCVHNL
jgi:hypothetical protein